jgi:hypothetical protein
MWVRINEGIQLCSRKFIVGPVVLSGIYTSGESSDYTYRKYDAKAYRLD